MCPGSRATTAGCNRWLKNLEKRERTGSLGYSVWQVQQADPRRAASLAAAIGAPGLLARVLVARGLDTPEKAMALLGQNAPLSDPFRLKDMDKAVARILRAIDEEEPMVVFGDYDVDGVTATALLYQHLRNMGAKVRCMLPSREGDGYGLSAAAVEKLAAKGYKLIVTVDNGISAVEEAALAARLGVDLVITDHHLPPETLPQAVAVVDPARPDDDSPYKPLCGAGVAFKLCAALDGCAPEELLDFCGDLAAIGTVADVMPLVGENRTLVQAGLQVLQNPDRPGLMALIESAGLGDKPLTAENISYALAPRINAAGRMGSPARALQLLLCEDEARAQQLTDQLVASNIARQEAEQRIMAEAEAQLAADPARQNDRVILVWGQDYHPGVIGIVASRLVEHYGKPVIVISVQEGEGKGSGRSVPGFNLHKAISACGDLLLRFGGHALAAGLSVKEENIPALRKALNEFAAREYPVLESPPLELDVTVRLDTLTVQEVEGLDYLAPCGNGNPAPLFLLENALIEGVYPVSDGRHCRLRLRQGGGCLYAAYFGVSVAQLPYQTGDRVDAAITLSIYQGKNGPQLSGRIRELRPAGLPAQTARQAALFDAFLHGSKLADRQRQELLPQRALIVTLYCMIQKGEVWAQDLQPVFAKLGPENTGRILAGLTALTQLGLVEICETGGAKKYAPVPVAQKQDLFSAPILKALEA